MYILFGGKTCSEYYDTLEWCIDRYGLNFSVRIVQAHNSCGANITKEGIAELRKKYNNTLLPYKMEFETPEPLLFKTTWG